MCSEDLCKLGKEYLNALKCKFYTFSGQNYETFDISHAFLPLSVAQLSNLKESQGFLDHLYFSDVFNFNVGVCYGCAV